jgi:cation transport regulator ChaB
MNKLYESKEELIDEFIKIIVNTSRIIGKTEIRNAFNFAIKNYKKTNDIHNDVK